MYKYSITTLKKLQDWIKYVKVKILTVNFYLILVFFSMYIWIIYIIGIIALPILVIVFYIANVALANILFAPWVPTRRRDLARIFNLIKIKPGDTFYDLGCGEGMMVFYAAKNYSARAIGLEINPVLYLICLIKKLFIKNPSAYFKLKSLFREDLSQADFVYFFAIPNKSMIRLKNKLEKELKPGTMVISYTFRVPGWEPIIIDKPQDKDLSVYVYKI